MENEFAIVDDRGVDELLADNDDDDDWRRRRRRWESEHDGDDVIDAQLHHGSR